MKPAIRTPTNTLVQVTRTFHAPIDSVWNSFTEPERVRRWLQGPPGWSMPICTMDFRVGGAYENRFRNDQNGSEFGWVGSFLEIQPHRTIVQKESSVRGPSDQLGEAAIITITFQETNASTDVTTRIEYASQAERDAALAAGMAEALELSYVRIDNQLAN